jgi:hypothetical protein
MELISWFGCAVSAVMRGGGLVLVDYVSLGPLRFARVESDLV